jgi:hypothetical protein
MAGTEAKEAMSLFAGLMPNAITRPGNKARQGDQKQKEQQSDIHDAAGVLKLRMRNRERNKKTRSAAWTTVGRSTKIIDSLAGKLTSTDYLFSAAKGQGLYCTSSSPLCRRNFAGKDVFNRFGSPVG